MQSWGGADHDSGIDAVVGPPGGPALPVRLKYASLVTGGSAPVQVGRWSGARPDGGIVVVVADRITADGRNYLTRAGWSWLDVRGHLRLVGPGVLVDADVPAMTEPAREPSGVVGQVGLEVATTLLLDPDAPVGIRRVAAALGRAPSAVSRAVRSLRGAGLVDAEGKPVVPALFWELVDHWKPVGRDLADVPEPARGPEAVALRLGLDDVETTVGWALTDTVAAAVYGAPVGVRADHPPDFYVPDGSTLRRAVRVLGPAATGSARAARVRVAPVAAVCSRRVDPSPDVVGSWSLVRPLFVALDLAQDPGRGREILDGWTPAEPWRRVW